MTSALYVHNHVPAYEFEWERFAWQYSVFDATWFAAFGKQGGPHAERFKVFSDSRGMKQDEREFRRWVDLRNDLMHQVLWGESIPGHRPVSNVEVAYLHLRCFSTIALLGAVGYKGVGLQADWESLAQHGL